MTDTNIQQTMLAAVREHQAGNFEPAEALYRKVLAQNPALPEANHNLGVLAMQAGRGLAIALPLFRAAWEANPGHQQHWASYVKALGESGDDQAAREVFADGQRRGLKGPTPGAAPAPPRAQPQPLAKPLPPAEAAKMNAACTEVQAMLAKNKVAAARKRTERMLKAHPTSAAAQKAAGLVLLAEGREPEALQVLKQALASAPRDAEVARALAGLCLSAGRHADAEALFSRLLANEPSQDHAAGLARAQLAQYRPDEALTTSEQARDRLGDSATLAFLRGEALQASARHDEAAVAYREALEIDPANLEAYMALGTLLREEGDSEGQLALCQAMGDALPDNPAVHADLGSLLLGLGEIAQAREALNRALELAPDNLQIRSTLLHCRNYLAGEPPTALLEASRDYGKRACRGVSAYTSWLCEPEPQQLRVGLVSGDLYSHPVGYFLESAMAQCARGRIQWYVYQTRPRGDALTERLKSVAHQWCVVADMTPADRARQMHADGLHLLIDLAGHTAHSGLHVFAWRPAPVQVSWLGYFATTGMPTIDYLLADPVSAPQDMAPQFSEQLWHLPDTRLCFTPPADAPPVAPPPALVRGSITLGCFQRLPKITDAVLDAWSQILDALPSATLRLQTRGLDDAGQRSALVARAAARGIGEDRLSLHGATDRAGYLAAHGECDLLLDTFPFSGATTTCEALWMGVPTVTLAGERMVSRQGASLLCAAGLPEFVAQSTQEYVTTAVARASDTARLATLRERLREQLRESPLCDAPRFARELERALWDMWGDKGAPAVAG